MILLIIFGSAMVVGLILCLFEKNFIYMTLAFGLAIFLQSLALVFSQSSYNQEMHEFTDFNREYKHAVEIGQDDYLYEDVVEWNMWLSESQRKNENVDLYVPDEIMQLTPIR
jgi:hypothetical protein